MHLKKYFLLILIFVSIQSSFLVAQSSRLLFGVAYYDEYMPYERLEKDIKMMQETGINVVRIAESTWSTVEPQDDVYDFSHIDRVLNAMHRGNISVIIGTPTYAFPTWLVKKYPDILVVTSRGKRQYGVRQNMDITNGPDLHVYVSKEKLPVNFIDLGKLKSIKGNQVYTIPGMPDFTAYKYALVHCQQYNHLFGSALLQ